jgi:hypothetical protein
MKRCNLLGLLLATSCGCSSWSTPQPPPAVPPLETPATQTQPGPLHEVPELPTSTALQFFCRDTGHLELFMEDGRWMVREPSGDLQQRAPQSYYEADSDRLSDDALRRIRAALDEVDFYALPARIDGNMPGADAMLTGGQGALQAQVYAFSAFDGAGAGHTVELEAEIRSLDTFGALQPLVESLDREAWGRWMNE